MVRKKFYHCSVTAHITTDLHKVMERHAQAEAYFKERCGEKCCYRERSKLFHLPRPSCTPSPSGSRIPGQSGRRVERCPPAPSGQRGQTQRQESWQLAPHRNGQGATGAQTVAWDSLQHLGGSPCFLLRWNSKKIC